MEAFATIEQYDARFPGRIASDNVLEQCLQDATMAIINVLDRKGIAYDNPSEELEYKLMSTCRSVANRILPNDAPAGATQTSMTAGPYTQTISITPAYGTPKLLPSEYQMLGFGGGSIGTARPSYGILEADDD